MTDATAQWTIKPKIQSIIKYIISSFQALFERSRSLADDIFFIKHLQEKICISGSFKGRKQLRAKKHERKFFIFYRSFSKEWMFFSQKCKAFRKVSNFT